MKMSMKAKGKKGGTGANKKSEQSISESDSEYFTNSEDNNKASNQVDKAQIKKDFGSVNGKMILELRESIKPKQKCKLDKIVEQFQIINDKARGLEQELAAEKKKEKNPSNSPRKSVRRNDLLGVTAEKKGSNRRKSIVQNIDKINIIDIKRNSRSQNKVEFSDDSSENETKELETTSKQQKKKPVKKGRKFSKVSAPKKKEKGAKDKAPIEEEKEQELTGLCAIDKHLNELFTKKFKARMDEAEAYFKEDEN